MIESFCRALAALLLFLPSPALSQDWIRIGSWNIQNLGERPWGQRPKAIAEHLHLAGLDLLALQEIHATEGDRLQRTNATLDRVLALLSRRDGQDWTYRLFPKADAADPRQLTGVAWNRIRMKLTAGPWPLPAPPGDRAVWQRPPHAAAFSAGPDLTDVVLIPVHFKSNVEGEAPGRRLRSREADLLVDALDRVRRRFADPDILILGDFNCLRRTEPALARITAAGFRDLNAGDRATYKNDSAPLDRILVPQRQPEFRYSRQYVLAPSGVSIHFKKLSDHYLVLTAVRVLADDD
jgi:endonuclease/exonuclease/phosphatase family metal-dependent hydrolase